MKTLKSKLLMIFTCFVSLFFSVSVWAHPDHASENLSQFIQQFSENTSPLSALLISLALLATLTTLVEIKVKSKKDDER